jgi:eukaryotic-like serine/threonine-protein kinase
MSNQVPERIGKYAITRELGRGGTSVVYLARDPFAGRDVAVKVMEYGTIEDPELRRRLQKSYLNEAVLVGKLFHPHILAIYDAVNEADRNYIVMEYVAGTTLEALCNVTKLLPIGRVLEVIFRCAMALGFAQRNGIIHCDLKPANILVSPDCTTVKVSDFGAALYENAEHTQLRGVGSPAYMSPEQIQDEEINHQTDIYSLGVVMYQMLTGRLPLQANNHASLTYQVVNVVPQPPSAFRKEIPDAVDRLVMQALQKKPENRHATWAEFSRQLTQSSRSMELPSEDIPGAEKFDLLRSLSFFQSFREQEIWETLRVAVWRRYATAEIVLREGDNADSFFVLATGQVRVSKSGHLLDILNAGDCFGEISFAGDPIPLRTTTITAMTPITAIELRAVDIAHTSDGCQKNLNRAFIRILINRLNWVNERLVNTWGDRGSPPIANGRGVA